jgi:hypothetical protein
MSEEIIKTVVENTLALAILAFLCKSIIKHWLDKDVKGFKNKIELEAKQTLSQYQSELEKERIRLQIQYGGIFEKQAEVILEFYKLIVVFQKAINDAMFRSDHDKSYEDFLEKWRELIKYYDDHQILLPESIEKIFNDFHKTAFFSTTDYRRAEHRINKQHITNELLERMFAQQDKALADIEQIPKLQYELKKCLRHAIGTVSESS